jgi:hypothetical protein
MNLGNVRIGVRLVACRAIPHGAAPQKISTRPFICAAERPIPDAAPQMHRGWSPNPQGRSRTEFQDCLMNKHFTLALPAAFALTGIAHITGEITAASSEQSDGMGQVNTPVVQLDQMTQQSAALVEKSAAAAESLKDQASKLATVVGNFQLTGQAGPAWAEAA